MKEQAAGRQAPRKHSRSWNVSSQQLLNIGQSRHLTMIRVLVFFPFSIEAIEGSMHSLVDAGLVHLGNSVEPFTNLLSLTSDRSSRVQVGKTNSSYLSEMHHVFEVYLLAMFEIFQIEMVGTNGICQRLMVVFTRVILLNLFLCRLR